jgi:hypothetical protein
VPYGKRHGNSPTRLENYEPQRKAPEFDSTIAAMTLRPEVSRLKRHLDGLAETLRIPQRAEAIARPNRYRFGPRRRFARSHQSLFVTAASSAAQSSGSPAAIGVLKLLPP